MIEPLMYFGIGFLVAALCALILIPLVHNRAVRLTARRLEAATPLSMAEIQADKDQLRADFAMSTRRLEMSVDQLKEKTASQAAELGKKGDAINQLRLEVSEKTATIFALEAREKELRDQLRATEDNLAGKTRDLHLTESVLADREAELSRVTTALHDSTFLAESQKIEIGSLALEGGTLKQRLAAVLDELKGVQERRDIERVEFQATTHNLAEERERGEQLRARIAELEQQLVAQITQTDLHSRRAADLDTRLSDQTRLLAQSEFELNQTRNELLKSNEIGNDLRTSFAELRDRAAEAIEQFRAEKAALQSDFGHAIDERDRLARDLAAMKREAEEIRAVERVENALLRERISEVAAEVARMASAMQGPNSPIDAILAAETARDRVGPRPGPSDAEVEAALGNDNLADRIRSLQSQPTRAPHGAKPTRRN